MTAVAAAVGRLKVGKRTGGLDLHKKDKRPPMGLLTGTEPYRATIYLFCAPTKPPTTNYTPPLTTYDLPLTTYD
ncbi:hypothetical protein [Parasediminibacterium sp. JCM 36343]|uniref:hypothetical protein n=1 Tax=Parasediminibacterium sp. JCM 36343 TaxID=3374279 RepID=UPI00397DF272